MLLFVMLTLLVTATIVISTVDYIKFNRNVYRVKETIAATPHVSYRYDLAMLNKILGDGEDNDD